MDFASQVTKRIDGGIVTPLVYLDGRKVNFSGFEVEIKYRGVDNRDYYFDIDDMDHDYIRENITFMSSQKARVENKRKAYRFGCNCPMTVDIGDTGIRLIGSCENVSYAGVAFICKETDVKLEAGQPVKVNIMSPDGHVEALPGKIARIVKRDESDVLIGIGTKVEQKDFASLIRNLQLKTLKLKNKKMA